MKITVDQGRCVGAGQCARLAPDVFDQREEDGVVTLLDPAPPPERHAPARDAADVCPSGAITLTARP
ncbi:ferredoxin [Bailinhaonella thermotolerans]|uniref:Ferredoxin n=1 Tax=Bailinhaonella thermotolerans TaxID=1070861 RepID=A0A3A4AK35_9ACTN|nr:ferredoxin [Bailinhaonella thermotolerans]RJL30016.1 ferredoxin [Bailinhaonella thermotolerans]